MILSVMMIFQVSAHSVFARMRISILIAEMSIFELTMKEINVSIWLSSFDDFFDSYVDYFIVEDFNVSENAMNVNFSITLSDSSN